MLWQRIRFTSLAALTMMLTNITSVRAMQEDAPSVAPPGTNPLALKEFNEGLMLFNQGKYAEARDKYANVVKLAPNFAEAHMMYGVGLLKTGQVSQAETELLQANSMKPDLPMGLIDLGSVYQMEGRYEEALAKFNRYLQLYPKGKHVSNVTALVNALKTERMRNQGATSSAGKEDYLSETVAIGAARWAASKMPLGVFIGSGAGVKDYHEEFNGILKQAFADWAEASQGKVLFKFLDTSDNADILVTWVDDPKQVINPAEGGQALVAPDTLGAMGRTKIKILTANPNVTSKVTDASLRHISLHEIGHALGLFGHSSQPGDVMFTTVNFGAPQPGLSERDKKTLLGLYSAPDSFFKEHKMKTNEGAMLGSDSNPTNRALRLNGQGIDLIKSGKPAEALKLFEEALRLDPESDYVKLNVGLSHSEMGRAEYNAHNFAGAEKYLLMAADEFEKIGRKDMEVTVCKNLVGVARAQGHSADVQKYQQRLDGLPK